MAFDLAAVRSRMPGPRIEWRDVIGSTMTEAARLAAQGAPSGTVVGAEEQTAGQGRHGRSWHSERGSGLYLSILLRRQFEPAALPVVTLALGLAVREAILKAARKLKDKATRHDFTSMLGGLDVDLLIRTGGEKRLSDFLLWECAYAELIFTPVMWPDFTASDLGVAVAEFHSRERRFGAVPAAALA